MGKKKFIDKKQSATFHLMARDTSDPNYSPGPSGDRVFVRVDNNPYVPESFLEDEEPIDGVSNAEPDSIFGDAPEDCDDGDADNGIRGGLPDHVRKEILELGFPDDGYNYLTHMREIKNTGAGSAYYENPKATFDQLPRDVKAYDASRVEVSKITDVPEEKSAYNVASKTVGVRVQKVLDPEVAALLDDSESSQSGSDIEDLEEDFVVRANLSEGPMPELTNDKSKSAVDSKVDHLQTWDSSVSSAKTNGTRVSSSDSEKPRIRRPLDEYFDMLELHEYGAESEEEYDGYMDEGECQESLSGKLNHALKDHPSDLLLLNKEEDVNESPELNAEVIRRCKEYAEKYDDGDHDEVVVLVEESSDESEVWDCETIITTYSTHDNHPGKIGAPESRRKKKLAEAISGNSVRPDQLITLKGKERLPVDFLTNNKKHSDNKTKDEKDVNDKRTELQRKKPRGTESKEEKKERKSAVKLERREARQVKKEMKGLYKSESNRAQKVAAFTGPSSIHLM